ncbi:putative F-box domain, galactose oxidase/kelch, beta-propeller, F-box associated interaction [Medicago truncatula]|uniref:F-box protein interaction domain protein n=1 Tax=Medicago truncatula TaxID=3880 RepID=A0A072USC1_MEDTR|nr:F-box/kelch-repeat protein At3g23880 [Medicago truncatula]KEH32246.1 F-box protein interaction domain protein [Medicago truncatula]RHN64161.1 putative F-box domain, galactose oxidase/kelch, beta-propeller, F-box associated interaction [Medicago truncatula]
MRRNNRHTRQRRLKKRKKNPPHLPHELVIQILLSLPVKSLTRFKCVCKSWFSLISHDAHFANSHFQLHAATQAHRIAINSNSVPEIRSIDLESSFIDDSAYANHTFLPYSDLELKCSCRGFILLHTCSDIHLWNPSTGAHKQIPLSPNHFSLYFYGFGYDQLTDDYLVVLLSYDSHSQSPNILSHLEFFSLRDNVWKEIECTQCPYTSTFNDNPHAGSLYNGAIHWLAFHRDFHPWYDNVIVAFDLTERKLLEMSPPDDLEHIPQDCGLWVFGDFFSIWAANYANDTVEIWVMKEYKVKSSWTVTLVLPIDGIPTMYFYPLCCTKSGYIIGTDGEFGLVKYDDNGELLEHSSKCEDPCGGSQVVVYTKSLLSLGDN